MTELPKNVVYGKVRDFIALKRPVTAGRSGSESTHWIAHDKQRYRNGRDSTAFQSLEAELAGSGRRDFAVKNSYALQRDAQVLLVSTDEAGLGFSDQ
jgi:hypothetical protein